MNAPTTGATWEEWQRFIQFYPTVKRFHGYEDSNVEYQRGWNNGIATATEFIRRASLLECDDAAFEADGVTPRQEPVYARKMKLWPDDKQRLTSTFRLGPSKPTPLSPRVKALLRKHVPRVSRVDPCATKVVFTDDEDGDVVPYVNETCTCKGNARGFEGRHGCNHPWNCYCRRKLPKNET